MERARGGAARRRGQRLRRLVSFTLLPVLVLLAALVVWQWVGPPWYRFPEPQSFAGPRWYNPYAHFDASAGTLRANFHVHARSWGGLTSGEGTSTDVQQLYVGLGYDVPAVSNYQSIVPPPEGDLDMVYVPAYEHGFGTAQVHFTAIGAGSVSWLDYPLWSRLHHKQHVIDRLRSHASLVVLNHPRKGGGISDAELALLTGYDGIEIRSRHARDTRPWDAALSAGRRAWGFASDDARRLRSKPQSAGKGWLVIQADARNASAVLDALRVGRFYAAFDRIRAGVNRLVSARLQSGALRVELEAPADMIRFVGQGGRVLAEVADSSTARYTLRDSDSYVRVETVSNLGELFLNPVFRYTDDPFAQPSAQVRVGLTWLSRGAGGAVALGAVWLVLSRRRTAGRARRVLE